MVRYNYTRQIDPPAPFLYVNVARSDGAPEGIEVAAQLDSGADITVLPFSIAKELELAEAGEFPIMGFGGLTESLPVYVARITPRGLTGKELRVIASEGEPYILLGRDLLNSFRVVLDGPALTLEMT
jgi:predicted aspartyl protease